MSDPSVCIICEKKLEDGTELRSVKQRGINTLIAKSKEKDDDKWKNLEDLTQVKLHERCRMNYILIKKPTAADDSADDQLPYDFRTHCFLCAKVWRVKDKHGRVVTTQQLQDRVEKCIEARDDEWSEEVRKRIDGKSLMVELARYHGTCYNRFVWIPLKNRPEKPKIVDLETAFENVCKYLEEHRDQVFYLTELLAKMEGWTTNAATFKQKIIDKYGNDIWMVERRKLGTIVCFRSTGYEILKNSSYQKKTSDKTEERLGVVRRAADIIREDINSKESLGTDQPDIPQTLSAFLDTVVLGRKGDKEEQSTERESMAHSIMSAVNSKLSQSGAKLETDAANGDPQSSDELSTSKRRRKE